MYRPPIDTPPLPPSSSIHRCNTISASASYQDGTLVVIAVNTLTFFSFLVLTSWATQVISGQQEKQVSSACTAVYSR